MNELKDYEIDYKTGLATAITGDKVSDGVRQACDALNRTRSGAIEKAIIEASQRESIKINDWTASFERVAAESDTYSIPLDKLGIESDKDGFLTTESALMEPLESGAEAIPYLDKEAKVVYKLFYLRGEASLGKKVKFVAEDEGHREGLYSVELDDANLIDTLKKLSLLNAVGGHPTEIVGLSHDCHYLIAKQPLAYEVSDFITDRQQALKLMRAVLPQAGSYRRTVAVVWFDNMAWLIDDLHERNVMIDSNGYPTVIDALVADIPELVVSRCAFLSQAVQDAKLWAIDNRAPPSRDLWDRLEVCHDDEL